MDSIKVDRTFVMFPSFRMLSQSFYQWADHRDREREGQRERESIRKMFLQPCLRLGYGPRTHYSSVSFAHFGPENTHTLHCWRFALFFFFLQLQLHINNLLSFVCVIFQRGEGRGRETWKTLNTYATNCVYHSFNTLQLCYKSS